MPMTKPGEVYEQYEWFKESAATVGFFGQVVESGKKTPDNATYVPKMREYLKSKPITKEQKSRLRGIIAPWYAPGSLPVNQNDMGVREQANNLYKANKPDDELLNVIDSLLRELEQCFGSQQAVAKHKKNEMFHDVKNNKSNIFGNPDEFAQAVSVVDSSALEKQLESAGKKLDRVLDSDASGVQLSGDKDEKSNAAMLTVIIPSIDVLASVVGFLEAFYDYIKSYRNIYNFNTWLNRELVVYSRLNHEMNELQSTEKMHELKIKRDADINPGNGKGKERDFNNNDLEEIERKLFKGNISIIEDLTFEEYKVELRERLASHEKIKISKNVEIDLSALSTDQFLCLIFALEKRHLNKLIKDKEDEIEARFKLHFLRKRIEKDKLNISLDEINESKDNLPGTLLDKIEAASEKHDIEIEALESAIKSVDEELAESSRLVNSLVMKKLALHKTLSTVSNDDKLEFTKDEVSKLQETERRVMKRLHDHHAEQKRKLISRLCLVIAFSLFVAGTILGVAGMVTIPVAIAIVAVSVIGSVVNVVAERIKAGETSQLKNSVFNLPSRIKGFLLFRSSREQAKLDAVLSDVGTPKAEANEPKKSTVKPGHALLLDE